MRWRNYEGSVGGKRDVKVGINCRNIKGIRKSQSQKHIG